MIISPMSDLHLEFDDLELPGGDVLVLAGDIWVASHIVAHPDDKVKAQRRNRYIRFCREELPKYRKVVVILGNHEHYGTMMGEATPIIRKFLKENAPNAVLLDNEAVVIDDIAFIGSTLWAKYGAGERSMETIMRNSITDFQVVSIYDHKDGMVRSLDPSDLHKMHIRARAAVNKLLHAYANHKCVLVTHHAPTLLSGKNDPHWRGNFRVGLDSAYYSTFLHYLGRKRVNVCAAIHGHTHVRVSEWYENVRVISNPRGYAGRELLANGFDPNDADFQLI